MPWKDSHRRESAKGRDMREMLADCMMAGEKEGKPRVQSEQRTLIGERGSL